MKKCLLICVVSLFVVIAFNQTRDCHAADAVQAKASELNVAAKPVVPFDPNAVLVTVNGEKITAGQLQPLIKQVTDAKNAGQSVSQTLIDQMSSQSLDNLMTEVLVNQQLKANNIVITDKDIEDYIKKMISTVEPPMTLDDLKTKIKDSGKTYEQWKEMAGFEKRMQIEKLLEISNPEQMKVSDEEAQKYYDGNPQFFNKPEQVRASHILIRIEKSEPNKAEQKKADAKKKALDILDKIKKGADFAAIAKEFSDDKASAVKGGDLNYFVKAKMVPPFADAAFSLKAGQISDPVETTYGYHIIKVVDHRDASTVLFEKAKPGIVDFLKSEKLGKLVEPYIEKIKEEAKLVYPAGSTLRAYQPSKTQIQQPEPITTPTGTGRPAGAAGAGTTQMAPKQQPKPPANQPK